ncbi:MAG: polysaccharide biosynthesis protein [Paludibacter sp.]|nr:polysaccharide biosynthesis protein [Paludibacter sp.]MDD4428905.1 polysaccharide biosynthesis protein [Paludibacter sp.]
MDSQSYYYNKVILVTGGVGSIGSQLVRSLLTYQPKSLIIMDNNETGLFDLSQELKSDIIQIVIGDIRDSERMIMVMTGVEIVFHAAALKHVPLCEFNPYEAVKTNILGTQNVLNAAILNHVQKVIMISTDKAVDPVNTMGATKYLAERLTIAANNHQKNEGTVFSVVRFGNVLNSRGSIIPIFMQQIENNLPLTITDPDMTRFVMTIPQAAELVIKTGVLAKGMEIFILKMPVLKIIDLANVMLQKFAPRYGYDSEHNPMKIIGKRVGEKLYEELMTVEESAFAFENGDMFIVYPPNMYDIKKKYDFTPPVGYKPVAIGEYSSYTARIIDNQEIEKYLVELEL